MLYVQQFLYAEQDKKKKIKEETSQGKTTQSGEIRC